MLGSSYWTGAIVSGVGVDGEGADDAALVLASGEATAAGAGWLPLPVTPNASNPTTAPDITASTSVITNDLFSFMACLGDSGVDRGRLSRAMMNKSAMRDPG